MNYLPNLCVSESLSFQAGTTDRDDPLGELLAFTAATVVDGVAITPRGYDVSDKLAALQERDQA